MTNKQLNELTSVSGIVGDDLIPIFDSSETGVEKLKKYTIQELKTDLTSMDPSAFGNWVKIKDYVETDSGVGHGTGSLLFEQDKVYKITVSVVTDGNNTTENFGFNSYFNGDWENTSRYITSGNSGGNGAVIQDFLYKEAKIEAEFTIYPAKKIIRCEFSAVDDDNTVDNRTVVQFYNHTDTITGWSWNVWGSSAKSGTATTTYYVWQEVKPIELHSYELVKEYNLNNETVDDTIDWDGEADPDIRIVTNIVTGRVDLYINGTTGTTDYNYGAMYSDGTTTTNSATTNAETANIGFSGRLVITEGNLAQQNGIKFFSRFTDVDTMWGISDMAWIGSSAVSSLRFRTAGANATGTVKIYKLAKAHLFNQTIYDNVTLNVTTTGSDTTGDGTSQKPFATINGALAWCKNKTTNDDVTITIQVADGTYNNLQRTELSNLNSKIVISGNSTTPSNVTMNFVTGQQGIYILRGQTSSISGLRLVGYAGDEWKAGASSQFGSFLIINNCEFDNWGIGAQSYHSGHMRVGNSTLNNCNTGGSTGELGTISIDTCDITNNNVGLLSAMKGAIIHTNVTFSGNTSNDTYEATFGTVQSY